ncbi:MAG: hypothetical protein WDK96_02665 [Candidatus Paceibacterota bacterium]|jgi:hypothetical protein
MDNLSLPSLSQKDLEEKCTACKKLGNDFDYKVMEIGIQET